MADRSSEYAVGSVTSVATSEQDARYSKNVVAKAAKLPLPSDTKKNPIQCFSAPANNTLQGIFKEPGDNERSRRPVGKYSMLIFRAFSTHKFGIHSFPSS